MGSTRGKLAILGGLALLWAILVFTRGTSPVSRPAAAPGETKEAPAREATPRVPATSGQFPRLKQELVELPQPPYPAETQNIFGVPPPPTRPSTPGQAAGGPGGPGGPGGNPAAPPTPPPPDPFQEGAKQLKYLGFLRSGATATAFIIQGPDLYTAATGEVVAGRFRVVDVQDDAVVLASPAGDKEVRLLLQPDAGGGAARPQAPAR